MDAHGNVVKTFRRKNFKKNSSFQQIYSNIRATGKYTLKAKIVYDTSKHILL